MQEELIRRYRQADFKDLHIISDRSSSLSPGAVFWLVRLLNEQGAINSAAQIIQKEKGRFSDPGDFSLASITELFYQLQSTQDVVGAVAKAEEIAESAARSNISSQKCAELDAYTKRLRLVAASCFAIPAGDALSKLDEFYETLAVENPDAALVAARWRISQEKNISTRLAKTRELDDRFGTSDQKHGVADAYVLCAEGAVDLLQNWEEAEDALDRADEIYDQCGHIVGPIDVRATRARVSLINGEDGIPALESAVVDYRSANAFARQVSLHTRLATRYQERGDRILSTWHEQQSDEISKSIGFGLRLGTSELMDVYRLLSKGRPSEAIEYCDEVLKKPCLEIVRATLEQQRARAFSVLNLDKKAIDEIDSAHENYVNVGAIEYASDAATERAIYRTLSRTPHGYAQADKIISSAVEDDEKNGLIVKRIQKLNYRSSLCLEQFQRNPDRIHDESLLNAATLYTEEALSSAVKLPEGIKQLMDTYGLQQKSHIAAARGNFEAMQDYAKESVKNALKAFRPTVAAGNLMMLAIDLRNIANGENDLLKRANALNGAWATLDEAIGYFHEAGWKQQVADATYFQALCAADAATPPVVGDQEGLLNLAESKLATAIDLIDQRLNEVSLDNSLEEFIARRSVMFDAVKFNDLGKRIALLLRGDPKQYIDWALRSKARSLTDALTLSKTPSLIYADKDDNLELGDRLHELDPGERRVKLREIYSKGDELKKVGQPILPVFDVEKTTEWINQQSKPTQFVDWSTIGNQLWLSVLDGDGHINTALISKDINSWKQKAAQFFDSEHPPTVLRDTPEFLDHFSPLIEPLEELSGPSAMLVMSPTDFLHRIPLHALKLSGEYLIDRNSIIYAANPSLLSTLRKQNRSDMNESAFFGDPTSNLKLARELAQELAAQLNVEAACGERATKTAMLNALRDTTLIHFQGHSYQDKFDGLLSSLVMTDGLLTTADILETPEINTELLILGGCESAGTQTVLGGEPVGLTHAFAARGVNAILSTMWNVRQDASAVFLRKFLEIALNENEQDTARAYRDAMCCIKSKEQFRAPYYWAPFILTGNATGLKVRSND